MLVQGHFKDHFHSVDCSLSVIHPLHHNLLLGFFLRMNVSGAVSEKKYPALFTYKENLKTVKALTLHCNHILNRVGFSVLYSRELKVGRKESHSIRNKLFLVK